MNIFDSLVLGVQNEIYEKGYELFIERHFVQTIFFTPTDMHLS